MLQQPQDFITEHNGQNVEVAGPGAKDQCVDLVNAVKRDVHGTAVIEHTNAKDFPSRCGDDYDWIPYDGSNFPLFNDIIVWGEGIGINGHISWCIDEHATSAGFKSFDQNWPVGSPCAIVQHNYKHVAGWLRLKVTPAPNPQPKKRMKLFEKAGQIIYVLHDGKPTEFWLIFKDKDGIEKKREISKFAATVPVYAENDKYFQWSTEQQLKQLADMPEGKPFDLGEYIKANPECMEKQ